ncbi:DUF11 domain-containing protein [bacterium]|nr:DUF11 domain-containing protein [bacterium]
MKTVTTLMLLGSLLTAAVLSAQGTPNLVIDIQEEKVNMTQAEIDGNVPVAYAPGDTIRYTIFAKNTGDGPMVDATVVDPVPENVIYVIDSATGEDARILFSVNGGMRYSVWPVMVTATTANGTPVQREAGEEQVTHIKWLIEAPIPAGEQKVLTFKVVVK